MKKPDGERVMRVIDETHLEEIRNTITEEKQHKDVEQFECCLILRCLVKGKMFCHSKN